MTKTKLGVLIKKFVCANKIQERRLWIKLKLLLAVMTDEDIVSSIGMAEMPLVVYLLSLKHFHKLNLIPINNNEDVMIRVGRYNVANMSYLALYLHFLTVNDDSLVIEGTTSYPSIVGIQDLYAIVNGEYQLLERSDVNLDLKLGEKVYEKREAFYLEIPIKEETRVVFANRVADTYVEYGRINSMRFSPIADKVHNQYFEKDGWIFRIESNAIVWKKVDVEELSLYELYFRKSIYKKVPQKASRIFELRDYYFKNKNHERQIWLFMDRPDRADDNAKILFKYVQNYSNIDSYFLLSRESHDYDEMSNFGNVIDIYSQQHFRLALVADYIISSQCNGIIENPFWEEAEYFRDIYHRPKMIFLQHGTIKDDMSNTLNRFNTNFTGFITSTRAEYQSILDYPYFYTSREVWLTGQPRYDELYDAREKFVLIMPSWRKGLMKYEWDEEKHNMEWRLKEDFSKSLFYKKYRALLQNRQLQGVLNGYGYSLALCMHPLMKKYANELMDGTDCMIIDVHENYRDLFARASLLITDYSSVAFDFAFLRKPVIYYQFDKESFFFEHTYKEGYFDYEKDGFGPVCTNESMLVKEICNSIDRDNFLSEKYRNRVDAVFEYENGFCERVFKHMQALN